MKTDVHNKVALVTGANRGIGKAIVEALIAHGVAKVYLAVRDIKSAAELVQTYGATVQPVTVDMAKPESISALAEQASDVTVVINNAGILDPASPLDSHAVSALEKELKVNLFGLLHLAQTLIPVLEKNGGGAFVQLNSVVSIKTFANFATYSASKAATYSITQALRDVVADKNIQVLSVHPGPIATDMAVQAGMAHMGEPPAVVGEGIVAALASGQFHLFPDSMAKDFGGAYQSYAENIIEANLSEA